MIFACGSVGYLIGAALVVRIARRLGAGPTIILAAIVMVAGQVLVPLAGGSDAVALSVLVVSWLLTSLSAALYSITQLSLRQSLAPEGMLGRVNATMRCLSLGLVPVGALLGGVLGELVGPRGAMVAAAFVLAGCLPLLLAPPLRSPQTVLPDSSRTAELQLPLNTFLRRMTHHVVRRSGSTATEPAPQ